MFIVALAQGRLVGMRDQRSGTLLLMMKLVGIMVQQ